MTARQVVILLMFLGAAAFQLALAARDRDPLNLVAAVLLVAGGLLILAGTRSGGRR